MAPPLRGLIPAVAALAMSPALFAFLGAALSRTSTFGDTGTMLVTAALFGGPLILCLLSAWLLRRAHEPLWGLSALALAIVLGLVNLVTIVLGLEFALLLGA